MLRRLLLALGLLSLLSSYAFSLEEEERKIWLTESEFTELTEIVTQQEEQTQLMIEKAQQLEHERNELLIYSEELRKEQRKKLIKTSVISVSIGIGVGSLATTLIMAGLR